MPKAFADHYQLGNFIDTFALGHYARVLDAVDLKHNRPVAFKIMRPEHMAPDSTPRWEAQAFPHEANLLTILSDHPAPIRFYDCGYISAVAEYPTGGEIESFGQDVQAFRDALYEYNAAGWRPYLSLENIPRVQSLFYVMKSPAGQRRRLPTEEGIDLAMQFGELLGIAHQRGIVYMDHKLEHIYWDGYSLRVIDWNSSKLIQNSPTLDQEQQKDIHNMCVGVLYTLFTGMPPHRGELRPQPGNQSEVDARYAGITQLDFGVEPTLSAAVIHVLEQGAQQRIHTASDFLQKMQRAAHRFGWHSRDQAANAILAEARDHIREGLLKLRLAEDLARESQELFLAAATMDGINEDIEQELRRLMKGINEFINARIIP